MTALPLAARASGIISHADPRAQSTLRRVQSACLVLTLSIAACLLLCGQVPWMVPLTGRCETLSLQALLIVPAAIGLALLHPGAPGPSAPTRRRVLVLGTAWLLVTGGGATFSSMVMQVLSPLSTASAGQLASAGMAVGPGAAIPPLLAVFLLVQGLLLMSLAKRRPGKGLEAGLLTLALMGLCVLAIVSWGIGEARSTVAPIRASAPPPTLIAMLLLGAASVAECAQRPGMLSVLTSLGIGSRRVRRLVLPALLLPGTCILAAMASVEAGLLGATEAAALFTSAGTMLLLFVLLSEGHQVNRLEANLRLASLTDDLTHLYNRRAFMVLGEQALADARRQGRALSVLYFDLDRLKPVNDAFGHAAGSHLLREFADILRHTSRASDIVARIGGDEFAVVTPAAGDDLERQVERLAAAVSERNRHGRRPYLIRYSVGRSSCEPSHSESFESLVAEADARMYAEKQGKSERPARLATGSLLVLDRNS